MPRMPRRKEIKEKVVHVPSKRKFPTFKPPGQLKRPRIPTTEAESSNTRVLGKKPAVTTAHKRARLPDLDDDDDDDDDDGDEDGDVVGATRATSARVTADQTDSDEDLADDPLTSRPKSRPQPPPNIAKKRKAAPARMRDLSPGSTIDSQPASSPPLLHRPSANATSEPWQKLDDDDPPCSIPQTLLLRLLHEHFASGSTTKIDKHAIQVVQKYVEVFVREAIARAALLKREEAMKGELLEQADAKWLDLETLEKVAPGMMIDFG